jgi:hypothetical protein
MKNNFRTTAALVAEAILFCIFAHSALAQTNLKEAHLTTHATGPFEVKITPADEKSDDPLLGRLMLDKQFHGDLDAISKGQMLTAGTPVKGSGAYVAIEKVTGTLHGRSGSFVLQHTGTMTQGAPLLTITVVPDSGSGQLVGITGKMTINIVDGKHLYDLEYTLPTVQ